MPHGTRNLEQLECPDEHVATVRAYRTVVDPYPPVAVRLEPEPMLHVCSQKVKEYVKDAPEHISA